jgi:hypothetical protein
MDQDNQRDRNDPARTHLLVRICHSGFSLLFSPNNRDASRHVIRRRRDAHCPGQFCLYSAKPLCFNAGVLERQSLFGIQQGLRYFISYCERYPCRIWQILGML